MRFFICGAGQPCKYETQGDSHMKKETDDTFPQGWNDADEDAMFDTLRTFTQTNSCCIKNTASHDAIAQNSFIEGFIACYEYCNTKK